MPLSFVPDAGATNFPVSSSKIYLAIIIVKIAIASVVVSASITVLSYNHRVYDHARYQPKHNGRCNSYTQNSRADMESLGGLIEKHLCVIFCRVYFFQVGSTRCNTLRVMSKRESQGWCSSKTFHDSHSYYATSLITRQIEPRGGGPLV